RIGHQPGQFVGGRPAAIGSAVADLGEIVLRLAIVSQQRAEPDVDRHRDSNDGQRDQEKLNGQGGRGGEWAARRDFSLDEFVHAKRESGGCQEVPESGKFYHPNGLAVKLAGAAQASSSDGRGDAKASASGPAARRLLSRRVFSQRGQRAAPTVSSAATGLRNGIIWRRRAPTCSIG